MCISGTSMGAPMETGVGYLIREANPKLSTAEVKDIILQSARTDNLTGPIGPEGHARWGHGKLDAYSEIQRITITAVSTIAESMEYVFPHPSKDII